MRFFHFTKLFVSGALLLIAMSFLSGCKQRPDSISKREILTQTNKQLRLSKHNRSLAWIQEGKYELSDSTKRTRLRELEAAGLGTYDVARYAWWEKSIKDVRKAFTVKRSFYGFTYNDTEYRTVKTDTYEFCDHYVVDFALTDKGKKLIVDDIEATPEKDKYYQMESDLENPFKYIWRQMDLSEEWPEIDNPFIEKDELPTSIEPITPKLEEEDDDEDEAKPVEPKEITRIDSLQYQAFMNLDLVHYKGLFLKAYDIKAIDVRDIRIYEESGFPKCKAELVLVIKNVTDAGRILYGASEGIYYFHPITLDYYVDKGWILDKEPLLDYIGELAYNPLDLNFPTINIDEIEWE